MYKNLNIIYLKKKQDTYIYIFYVTDTSLANFFF